MTKRFQRMNLLVMLAQKDEDACALAFQKYQAVVEEQEAKLSELNDYYESYRHQFSERTQKVRVEDIINSRGLLARLADAQNFQKQQIAIAKEQEEVAKKNWQEKRLKHQSLIDLQSRCVTEEQFEYDRMQQKEADEWSSLAFNHKK